MTSEYFDVLVVGAGISGIGAGYHLQTRCPDRTYAILEARNDIGGTWDLFRYPGIRIPRRSPTGGRFSSICARRRESTGSTGTSGSGTA
jgi:cation diffusion facilitator CzcD-associated flavoprotein CzcO